MHVEQHGVARTSRTRTVEQRQQELDKISKYQALEGQVRQQVVLTTPFAFFGALHVYFPGSCHVTVDSSLAFRIRYFPTHLEALASQSGILYTMEHPTALFTLGTIIQAVG